MICEAAWDGQLSLLLLLQEVGSARLRESDLRPISPKANKKALALLLKTTSPTPSNAGSARSFQRDTEREIKVLQYCEVLQRGG